MGFDLMYSRLSRQRQATIEHSLLTITQRISQLNRKSEPMILPKFSAAPIRSDHCIQETKKTEHNPLSSIDLPNDDLAQLKRLNTRSGFRKPKRNVVLSYWDTLDCFFATIEVQRTMKLHKPLESPEEGVEDSIDAWEEKTSYFPCPASWLLRLGFHHGFRGATFSFSTAGWKQTLETFRSASFHSLIFVLCEEGDFIGVRDLITRGQASIRDTDPLGCTPLHVRAQ